MGSATRKDAGRSRLRSECGFECAVHAVAPECPHCHCKVLGHGAEAHGVIYCCAHCAKESGESGLRDRA